MLPNTLAELLKLPTPERIELAIALWEGLEDSERDAEFALTLEQMVELDDRMAAHLLDPRSAIPWEQVRRKLAAGA